MRSATAASESDRQILAPDLRRVLLHDLPAAGEVGCLCPFNRASERSTAHRVRKFHAHMSEAAKADNSGATRR